MADARPAAARYAARTATGVDNHLASDAVDDDPAQKITDNGETLLAAPFDVPDSGRLCRALGPQGAAFGVWQAA